jgi:hypothetical protein
MTDTSPFIHFYVEPIEVSFDQPPLLEKAPPCPDGFTWQGQTYRVTEMLAEWHDYRRRGRFADNMQPAHARVAAQRGSLGVGRFYFRVRVDTGQVFEIYYDRAPTSSDDKKGHWFLVGEREAG